MALIKCSECGSEISDKAAACLKCGNPINIKPQNETQSDSPYLTNNKNVITTEQTSKIYKFGELVGVLMICAGVISCTAGSPGKTSWLFGIGLLILLGSRIGAWWNNG